MPENREALPDRVERAIVEEAAGMLSMTQCPYYQREEKCDRGCYSEPLCQTGQPIGGWEKAALELLESALATDEQEATGA